MKLLIFPGAGDPHAAEYSKVYQLLRAQAGSFGYSEVDTSIRWPGQFLSKPDSTEALNLKSAVAVAKRKLGECEASAQGYDILARSFGTVVALSASFDGSYPNLRRIVLWGTCPYWKAWEMFVDDFDSTRQVSQQKGVRIEAGFFSSCEPIETLLLKTPRQVVVTVGGNDKYSSREFHSYLLALLMEHSNVTFRHPVEGAPHEVTGDLPAEVVQQFCRTVLGSS